MGESPDLFVRHRVIELRRRVAKPLLEFGQRVDDEGFFEGRS
jgi:hypothetical protein